MSIPLSSPYSGDLYRVRREKLKKIVDSQYPDRDVIILLFANLDFGHESFRQESSFFYTTGLQEPGLALIIDQKGETFLYKPVYGSSRTVWTGDHDAVSEDVIRESGVQICSLGDPMPGYQTSVLFEPDEYKHLIKKCRDVVAAGGFIATLQSNCRNTYVHQQLILNRLCLFAPDLSKHFIDISPHLATMRRVKDEGECGFLIEAIEITMRAHQVAAREIQDGVSEKTIQLLIESEMYESGAQVAFPSIVATGINGTILHYTKNKSALRDGDLLVIDIGAEYQHYSADITRTYPVSGTFTKRQRDLYSVVLDTQRYIEYCAKPGIWLNNKDCPEKSLNHLAREFLKKKGYAQYFPHGIGHYLGLDTHDVGDYKVPLQEGDVITIEPGIYISQEQIGIRIEDDYLVTKTGVICLSEDLVKEPDEIEQLLKKS